MSSIQQIIEFLSSSLNISKHFKAFLGILQFDKNVAQPSIRPLNLGSKRLQRRAMAAKEMHFLNSFFSPVSFHASPAQTFSFFGPVSLNIYVSALQLHLHVQSCHENRERTFFFNAVTTNLTISRSHALTSKVLVVRKKVSIFQFIGDKWHSIFLDSKTGFFHFEMDMSNLISCFSGNAGHLHGITFLIIKPYLLILCSIGIAPSDDCTFRC